MRELRSTATLASRQHGVFRADQTRLDPSALWRATQSGVVRRHYRGVYSVGPISRDGRLLAAVFAAGEGAALASFNAVVLWNVSRFRSAEIHVVVPRKRRPHPGFRLLIKRDLLPTDILVLNGIPVTTVARALLDMTDVLLPEQLANLIHEAEFWERFDEEETRAVMARATTGRPHVLDRALQLHAAGSAGTRSALEDRFLKLVRGAGLAEPIINTHHLGFEIDFRWPGLAVEIDGPGHDRPRTKTDDRIQDAALQAQGFRTLRFREQDLDDPAAVLRQLAA
jgi:Protein of unknown function (DUF559)